MDTTNDNTSAISIDLIRDKAQALRTEADYLERLERELRQAVAPQSQAPRVQVNLLQAVREVLLSAPDHRLTRTEIIARVRSKVGQHVKPIGIISTLARKSDFKKVDGDSFQLKSNAQVQ